MFENQTIVLPWDFSELAEKVLKFVVGHNDTKKLLVVCVLEIPLATEPSIVAGTISKEESASRCREKFAEFVKRNNLPTLDFHVRFGDSASEIVSFAKTHAADLIVMSSHGRSGVKRLMLGSVAENVVRTSPCAVMLFPRSWLEVADNLIASCEAH